MMKEEEGKVHQLFQVYKKDQINGEIKESSGSYYNLKLAKDAARR